jgi:hypothetical protein
MGDAQRLIESMNNANVDVLVFPTWSNPPHLIGDFYTPDGAQRLTWHSSRVACADPSCAQQDQRGFVAEDSKTSLAASSHQPCSPFPLPYGLTQAKRVQPETPAGAGEFILSS